ncbi:MAG: hypothetical protein MHMPM18_004699 [Marteilia pararefringens]
MRNILKSFIAASSLILLLLVTQITCEDEYTKSASYTSRSDLQNTHLTLLIVSIIISVIIMALSLCARGPSAMIEMLTCSCCCI